MNRDNNTSYKQVLLCSQSNTRAQCRTINKIKWKKANKLFYLSLA